MWNIESSSSGSSCFSSSPRNLAAIKIEILIAAATFIKTDKIFHYCITSQHLLPKVQIALVSRCVKSLGRITPFPLHHLLFDHRFQFFQFGIHLHKWIEKAQANVTEWKGFLLKVPVTFFQSPSPHPHSLAEVAKQLLITVIGRWWGWCCVGVGDIFLATNQTRETHDLSTNWFNFLQN